MEDHIHNSNSNTEIDAERVGGMVMGMDHEELKEEEKKNDVLWFYLDWGLIAVEIGIERTLPTFFVSKDNFSTKTKLNRTILGITLLEIKILTPVYIKSLGLEILLFCKKLQYALFLGI